MLKEGRGINYIVRVLSWSPNTISRKYLIIQRSVLSLNWSGSIWESHLNSGCKYKLDDVEELIVYAEKNTKLSISLLINVTFNE